MNKHTFPTLTLDNCAACGSPVTESLDDEESVTVSPLITALHELGLLSAEAGANWPALLIQLDHEDARRLTALLKETDDHR